MVCLSSKWVFAAISKAGSKFCAHVADDCAEQDAALAILNNQLESNQREHKGDKAKSNNVGWELASTTDRLKKLTSDVMNFWSDYDKLATQHHESKSENSRTKKELMIVRKKVQDQMELTLVHKERMKDKELKRERIRFD
jgi:hypothetical protein